MAISMLLEDALEIFKRTGVMQEGHFQFTSGRHSDNYMQCARLFEFPDDSVVICSDVAEAFRSQRVDFVAGPAIGGIIMAYEVARILGVRNIFAERENGAMTLRRGFDITNGGRVLVVEDVVTTGGSVKEVIELLRGCGAEIAGVGAVIDRSGGAVDFGVPFHAVATMNLESWEANECHLCRQGVPLTKPGSRK
jgi:orotate phosphoribosyltransferase